MKGKRVGASSRRAPSKINNFEASKEVGALISSFDVPNKKDAKGKRVGTSSRRTPSKNDNFEEVDALISSFDALALDELERVLSSKFDAPTTLRYSTCIRDFVKKIDNEDVRNEFIFQLCGQFMVTCDGDALITSFEFANEWWDTYAFDTFKQSVLDAIRMRTEGVKIEKCDLQCRNRLCRSYKCVFFLQQTRSADEGMTAFVLCTKCSTRYRLG
jgi:DNA-directed RNA polymerase subunit M/transcription elongation factor TFIIS